MKLLFDQNISFRILKLLTNEFEGSTHVLNENLINSTDREIWEFAKKNNYTIVTQDSDFNDLNSLLGFPPKIIWFRTGNMPTEDIFKILLNNYTELSGFLTDYSYGCFEIVKLKVSK
ncbi:MAG: DUF5615 family PIN-like protein [Bacteroidales bacterium]|nr:DUF5615 family PIN-like protein [Bacteroidales bacterium]